MLAGTGAFFIDNGNYIHWACQSENGNVTTSISVDCKQKIDDGSSSVPSHTGAQLHIITMNKNGDFECQAEWRMWYFNSKEED